MENNGQEKRISSIKLIIVGSVNVGKTSLLTRYATGKFQEITKSTSNASFISKIKVVNNKKYEIKLWDTAGQEKYSGLTKIFTKEAKIALLVYAIDDKKTFDDLNKWLDIVKETNTDKIILGIAANKADLYKKAQVTDEQGKNYAKEIGAEWRSTSSLLDDCGIDDLVDTLFNKYIEERRLKKTASINEDRVILKKKGNSNEKKSVCCAGSRDKKNSGNKNIKNVEVIENNENPKEDEDF
jgi:small GTP-binding protein